MGRGKRSVCVCLEFTVCSLEAAVFRISECELPKVNKTFTIHHTTHSLTSTHYTIRERERDETGLETTFLTNLSLFLSLSVCLSSICHFVHPFVIHLSVRLSIIYLSFCPSICHPSVCLPVYLSVHPFVILSIYPSIRLSVRPSVCLAICLRLRLRLFFICHIHNYIESIYIESI